MAKLHLTLACRDYDRTLALINGTVQPEGIDLNYINLGGAAETFWRTLRHAEFDVSEISTSGYLITLERDPQPFIAIPVFPSRAFRHNAIFINTKSGITRPQDLIGRRVGLYEYSMTAALWVRGILQHEYDVPLEKIQWLRGGQTTAGDQEERVELNLPPNIRLENIPGGKTLEGMLEAGEIDAMISPIAPIGLHRGSPNIGRLFPDFKRVEMEYYKKTGIVPIMHTVAIKREIYQKHPWVAQSLYKAFCQSKDICSAQLYEGSGRYTMLWWLPEIEEEMKFFGGEIWPYGVERNRACLEALTQYSFEQGLTHKKFSVEELFAPETIDVFPGR